MSINRQLELALIERNVNQEHIQQRLMDGYINATALCKASDKKFNDYNRLKATEEFINELVADTGIPVSELIQIISGGTPQFQGTWVHPQVAINLAQWASPKFAVMVSKWVFEWMTGNVPNAKKLPYHLQRYIMNRSEIPPTHFSIFNEIVYNLIAPLEDKGCELPDNLVPDISEGKMFFLTPGVWHTYKPIENTGWNEYWIGFKGKFVQNILDEGFFLNRAPVFNIGLNERIIDLYLKAIEIANEERAGFQQALSGIAIHILGLMYYRDKTGNFEDEDLINKINKAKVIMREAVYKNISIEEIPKQLNISYSGFRKAFKEYTGSSPSRYMLELKLNEAKLLLSTTNYSIKEISFILNFENPDYFPFFFKKRTGLTPNEYRIKSSIKTNEIHDIQYYKKRIIGLGL